MSERIARRPPCDSLLARASISPASTFCAAACNALASDPPADGSAAKRKPSSRPTRWPSTVTSPVFEISLSNVVFSRRRRINTLVRRSTKRAVRRSCKASESLSSTPRVTPCQCSGSASQSGRLATKVQVRTCAIRVERESMSPSVWSACATWRGEPIGGDFTLPHQKSIEGGDHFGMIGRRDLPVVRNLTRVPQPLDGIARLREVADLFVARGVLKHQEVFGERGARQPRLGRRLPKATPATHRSTQNRDRNCAIAEA